MAPAPVATPTSNGDGSDQVQSFEKVTTPTPISEEPSPLPTQEPVVDQEA